MQLCIVIVISDFVIGELFCNSLITLLRKRNRFQQLIMHRSIFSTILEFAYSVFPAHSVYKTSRLPVNI